MSPSVRIDEDVYRRLQKLAQPFVDTPNSVLRRLLQLDHEVLKASTLPEKAPSARGVTRSAGRDSSGSTVRRATRSVTRSGSRRKAVSRRTKTRRIAGGVLLPLDDYKPLIVDELERRGGSGPARDLIEAVGSRVHDRLTPDDLEATKSGEVRWINRVQFARHRLVEEGVLAKNSLRGVWALATDKRD